MVFESVLSSVLNNFLGDFVENLDPNQLNVGIWGGDVVLKNLVIKRTALNDLDLPIQTVYGTIGKLVLQIPWKNLYSAPTIIQVEDVFLLVKPNQAIKYDAEKEEKWAYESKKKAIQQVADAQKAEAEKDLPKPDSTFVEKLVSNIIKNVQMTVKHVHIRYEDNVTVPTKVFAFGVTLSELVLESTDSNWKKCITEDISKIYKVVNLEALSVYWNSKGMAYDKLSPQALIKNLKTEIASKHKQPKGYHYMIGPITAMARLRINQRPENDSPPYSIPKVHLNLDMEKLYIGISKAQYRDLMALIDSMDRMSKGAPYRKYRPNVPSYKGHYKEWWHFAYTCVLEGEVRRRKRDWDWKEMKKYRMTCKEYEKLYEKMAKNKITQPETEKLEQCEKVLHLTNIVIIRQRVEIEVKKKTEAQQKETKGWFSWLSSSSSDIIQKFKAEMTPEEKQKLYKAIGYVGPTATSVEYPEEYVDVCVKFLLHALEVELMDGDGEQSQRILFNTLEMVKCGIETRVASNGLEVNLKLASWHSVGMRQPKFIPDMIISDKKGGDQSLLEVHFASNPIDKQCDQRIIVTLQPIKIIGDAKTIKNIFEVFTIPPDTTLETISVAASRQIKNVKAKTTTGLPYAFYQHRKLDVNIDIHALCIIPYGDKYTEPNSPLVLNISRLILNFGRLKLKLYNYGKRNLMVDIRSMYNESMSQTEILKFMIKHSYDKFAIELTNLDVVMGPKYIMGSSYRYPPISCSFVLSTCFILDDPNLPHNKVRSLPVIDIKVSEARIMLLVALISSIEFPKGEDVPAPLPLSKAKSGSSILYKALQNAAKNAPGLNLVQYTILEAEVIVKDVELLKERRPDDRFWPDEWGDFRTIEETISNYIRNNL